MDKMVPVFTEKLTQPKHYPCLCEVTKNVLFWARFVGILPIKSLVSVKGDIRLCCFAPSKFWIAYSVVLQLSYFVYFCVVYGIQLSCSRNTSFDDTDWYLMTVSYFMSDLDTIVVMFVGSLKSKKICKILEDLSKLDSSIVGMRNLHARLNIIVRCLLLYFTIMFSSFLHIAISQIISGTECNCGVIDTAFVITMRGVGKIFPTVQVTIACMLALLIEEKFEYLAESVGITIDNMSLVQQESSCGITTTSKKTIPLNDNLHMKITAKSLKLDQLAEMHQQIFDIQNEVNFSTGFQLLFGCCTSLYTIIYYLFRYITVSTYDRGSNNSRVHYILSLIYRFAKILIYMFLGHRLSTKSMRPLETVQRAPSISLPLHSQQQVQTLMLRWLGKRAYLSACGIFNFGPWLLAPIAGNVITYLLVALQFDNIAINDTNVTTIVQSPF